jgi:(2Fe-2S) ferredoxin
LWQNEVMLRRALAPDVHLFVCVNRRDASSPLGTGCAERGDAVYDAMKDEVAKRGAYRAAWVTRTHCLGVCPKSGTTVAVYPAGRIYAGVEAHEATALFDAAMRGALP